MRYGSIKVLPLLFVPIGFRGSFAFSGVAKLVYFIPFIVPMLMFWKVTTSRWGFCYLVSPDSYFNWLEITPRSLLFRYTAPQEEPTPYSYN